MLDNEFSKAVNKVLFEKLPTMPKRAAKPGYKWNWTGRWWDEKKIKSEDEVEDDIKNKTEPDKPVKKAKPKPVKYKDDGE